MEKSVSRDHQLYFRHTNSFTKKAITFQYNDTAITNTSIRGMCDVANDVLNKNVVPVPHYAKNKNSYFSTLSNETVADQKNIEFSFYDSSGKSVVNGMNKLLHSKSISDEESEEKRHKCSTFTPDKCEQTKKLNPERITCQNQCYSHNMYHLAYDQFINTSSFISLMAEETPVALMKAINDSAAVPLYGTLKLTATAPLDLCGYMLVVGYNKSIKFKDALQGIKLTNFHLRDEYSMKTETNVQKYQISITKNNLLNSTIKMQHKRKGCIKYILQEVSNAYEATTEHKSEKNSFFNHHISTNTKPINVKQESLDKKSKELTFISNTVTHLKYNKEMQNFLGVILETFRKNFQRTKINVCTELNMINATPNVINTSTSNFSHQRNNADLKVVNICNSKYDKIFDSLQDKECPPEYTQPEHQLYGSSASYHVISLPTDSDDNTIKIEPVQRISSGNISSELDIVADHDLMTLIDKEVDLSLKQYENNSLQIPQKNCPKEVECQTDLSLNCNRMYKYQYSDSLDIFNISNAYKMPEICHKRDNVDVLVDEATPTKRRCSTDVVEYQEADIVKWKIERYLSNNVLPADEANQIVPNSDADEEKYEFNAMELYNEEEGLTDKKHISAYRVCAYNSNETNSRKLPSENITSGKSLNTVNNRRPLRLGLSKKANMKRLHSHILGHQKH